MSDTSFISGLRERYGDEFLMDDKTFVCTERVFRALDNYESSIPTAPSAGRIYRRGSHWVRLVITDPSDDRYQLHVSRRLLVIAAAEVQP